MQTPLKNIKPHLLLVMMEVDREKIVKKSFEPLFNPRSIAVVGATNNTKKMGCHVLKSLIGYFSGNIYPINPRHAELFKVKVYPSLDSVPDEIDLVIIATPQHVVQEVMKQCAAKGVKAAVVITAGYREAEIEDGRRLHEELANIANSAGIRVIGPNTFGFANVRANLNASFTPAFSALKKGDIALVSQSGGICHVLMPYALREGIGFSKIIGLGNRLNTDFPDVLEYLKYDEDTKSIALYIEGLDNPRRLVEVARQVVAVKPIVAYKAGRFQKADLASKSHTGSLAGKYELYRAAFKQSGIIIAEDLLELISVAKALAFQRPASGNRVAVITLVAGLGIVSADVCENSGLTLAEFTSKTKERLLKMLPPYTMRTNPVDLGYIASDRELCGEVIKTVFADEGVDAVTINYVYSWSNDFLELPVDEIIEGARSCNKPVTMCLQYPPGTWEEERERLEEEKIPTFPTPELAAKALAGLFQYGRIRSKFSQS